MTAALRAADPRVVRLAGSATCRELSARRNDPSSRVP